ncbi:hypothetical protein T484DRAFT_1922186 [Baffinella frigidus]|nr:hypothetical protein T484DRAFT_1922186 [Cryptophyta sp. CCMP2293]
MPPSSSKVDEPADFDATVHDLEPYLEGFNSWMSQANASCAYIGFSPLAGIRTAAVTAGAHEYMKNARTESLLNDCRYKKVGEAGEGPDNMAMVLLQKEIQFFIIICRKFKCWEQYFASVANYTTNCGTNAFLKIIEHSNGLPTLRIQLQLLKTLATPPQGDTAYSHTTSCRAMMKLIAQVGPLDAATIGKIYIASSCVRSTNAAIAAIGTEALQTPAITLAEMTIKIENYQRTTAATEMITPRHLLAFSAPPPPRFANTKTFHHDAEMVTCKQCAQMVKDISFHLYDKHLDALKPDTQARLFAKHGKSGVKPPTKNTRGASKILSLTSAGGNGVSGGATFHATAQAYEAAGLTSFLWEDALLIVDESSTAYVVCPAKDTTAATVTDAQLGNYLGGPQPLDC